MSDELVINWGNAKEPVLPPEGNYDLVIDEYEIRTPKKAESAAHGFNIYIKFAFVDWEDIGVGEKFRIHHWIYFDVDDPWAAKPFFEALSGSKLGEESTLDPRNTQMFIGEKIKAIVNHDVYDKTDDDGNVIETKTVLKIKNNNNFYPYN